MGRVSRSNNNNSRISPHPFKDETALFTTAAAEEESEAEAVGTVASSEAVSSAEGASGESSHNCNEQQLRGLLNELTFWEPDCTDHAGEMKQPPPHETEEEVLAAAAVDSPTLQELEAANTWQKAVDPTSGRTYYYDSITRQSQWEKPREIRAIEKRMKKEHRQQLIIFFREMERNLLASLARGEVVPGRRELEQVGPPQEPLYNRGDDTSKMRVRTLSAVNEHLLAQLSMQERNSSKVSSHAPSHNNTHPHNNKLLHQVQTPSSPIQGRPPLPSRLPQQQQLSKPSTASAFSSNASSSNNNSSNSTNNNTNGMRSFHSSDSLELSPEPPEPKRSVAIAETDTLRGVDLLDHAEWTSSPDVEHRTTTTSVSSSSSSSSPNNDHAVMPRPAALHVRSHTAGGAVHDSMEQPDIDATINCVCSVFRAHIETARQQQSTSTPKPQQTAPPHTVRINFDVFRDDYEYRQQQQQQHGRFLGSSNNNNSVKKTVVPSVATIRAFYMEFYQRSQMEHDTIIMSLIYVERLMKMTNGALQPTPENWGSVLISCMILASKVWDDLSMWNIDFSNLSVSSGLLKPFSLSRINELELAVLTCLNFAVAIPASEYAKYYYLLRNMMIRGGLLALGSQQHQVLCKKEANRLENKTSHYQDSKLPQANPRRQTRSVDWSLLSSSAPTSGDGGNNSSGSSGGGTVLKAAVC